MRRAAVPLLACALLAAVALLLAVRSWLVPPPAQGARATASAVRVDGADAGTAPAAAAGGPAAGGPAAGGLAADGGARTASAAVLDYAAERTGYRGRVVAAQAPVPVPGINVTLCRGAPDLALPPGVSVFARAPIEPQIVAARARTGADGRFQLDGVLPRGLCFLRLEFPEVTQAPPPWRGGHGTTVPVQRTPAPGEVVDLGDLPLKPGATLTGRVVDEQGRPVAGATVRAARLPPVPFGAVPVERLRPDGALFVTATGMRSVIELPHWVADLLAELPIPTAVTSADGAFALYGVDPGVDVVAATAPGRASLLRQNLAVTPDATQALGDLELPAGEEVEVAVADPSGAPVAGAEVLVAPQSTGVPVHIAERAGRTDGDGRVRVLGLPRGSALAAARRSPKEEWVVGEASPVDGELRVTLPAAFSLTLAVLDPQSKPAADVQLRLVDAAANAGAVELAMFGLLRGVDLDDRLRRLDDGRLRIERLRAGTWCVVVGATGCASASFDVELRADVERTVQLRAARALRVRTIDADGAPVAAATIYVQSRGGERAQRIVDLPLAAGRTDGDGWCAVHDLPTDETQITASHPRFGQVHATIAGVPPETVLQFAAPCSLRGTLTDGGRPPAPGRWLAVLERNYDGGPRPAVPDVPELALPDLDGAFAFAALQPGRWRVTAQDSAADVGTVGGLWQYMARRKQIYPWNKAEVELHAGEQKEVRLDAMIDPPAWSGPGAVVRGTVSIDGAPAAGALVVGSSKVPDRTVTSRVDRAGTFDLGLVPAGALRLSVVPREVAESRLLEHLFSHDYARDLVVVDGVAQELAIEIATGALRGLVRDWNGAPVDGCRIVLFDRGGDGRSSALRVERSDAAGAFAFPQLAAGVFELRAQKDGYGAAAPTTVTVTTGSETGPVLVALRAIARVEGRVEVEALPRRAPMGLTLHPLGGGEPVRGGARAEGPFELKDVPEGSYRVELQLWGDPTVRAAGTLEVRAPATTGVVLVPQAK
jgi:hypothetical protein